MRKYFPRTKEAKKLVAVVITATFFIVMFQILTIDQQETIKKYSQANCGVINTQYLARFQR